MKPRSKPGKVVSSGRAARTAISNAKPLSESQMDHLREEKPLNRGKSKAGKGGRRADWDINYEAGIRFAEKEMPGLNEAVSQDGIRKLPKNGH